MGIERTMNTRNDKQRADRNRTLTVTEKERTQLETMISAAEELRAGFRDDMLVHGDFFNCVDSIPDEQFDLVIVDPPYNLAKYSTGNMKFDWRHEINNDVAEWDEKELDPFDLVQDFKRVLAPTGNIFIFCSYNLLGKFHDAFDSEFDTFQPFKFCNK